MVDKLLAGDASPGDLAEALGLGTNLLAHHLHVLEDAGVIRRVRSEGDRRRTYVQLRLDAPGGGSGWSWPSVPGPRCGGAGGVRVYRELREVAVGGGQLEPDQRVSGDLGRYASSCPSSSTRDHHRAPSWPTSRQAHQQF